MLSEIAILQKEKQQLFNQFGVEQIGIFGSVARGDNTASSDIDILASYNINTLHNYIALVEYLQICFNRKVDLVSQHAHLSKKFTEAIKKDIVYAW